MKEELMKICLLARENLTREYMENDDGAPVADGAPAAEIIYQDEEVTIAWPARLARHEEVWWEYVIDPIPPGIPYIEHREGILFLYPGGSEVAIDIAVVSERKDLFPSQESWLETMVWLMEKAGLSGPKQALKATLLFLDNDFDIDLF